MPPNAVSGYAVQMRVAWATSSPPIFTNLANADFGLTVVTPPADAKKYCALRRSGTTQRLVCYDSTFTATDYAIAVSAGKASLVAMTTASVPATTIALISETVGTDLDVYAIDDNGDLHALFGAPAATNMLAGAKCAVAHCVDDAIAVPTCSATPAKVLIHGGAGVVRTLSATGDLQGTITTGALYARLDNAGCVTQLSDQGAPTLVQAASIFTGSTPAELLTPNVELVGCGATACEVIPDTTLVRGAGVGFTTGDEPRMIIASIDATGVVLVEVVLASTSGTIERARMPAASLPDRVVTGQFDTDHQADVMWDIASKLGVNFEVAYARQVNAESLEALSAAQVTGSPVVTDILAGDLNGDALDDLVVLETSTPNGVAQYGVAVVPMGVPDPVTVTADATCSP